MSIFQNLFTNLPTAGAMGTTEHSIDRISTQLVADFSIHSHFDDGDIYESREMLVSVSGLRPWLSEQPRRHINAIVRRPVPVESIPNYLVKPSDANSSSSGMLYAEWFRILALGQQPPAQTYPAAQWVSVLRRAEAARSAAACEPGA